MLNPYAAGGYFGQYKYNAKILRDDRNPGVWVLKNISFFVSPLCLHLTVKNLMSVNILLSKITMFFLFLRFVRISNFLFSYVTFMFIFLLSVIIWIMFLIYDFVYV